MKSTAQFELLRREAFFAEAILGAGFTDLQASRDQLPGFLYCGLTGIAQGLERLLKLNHAVCHFLQFKSFPGDSEFRKLGHRLTEAINRVRIETAYLQVDWSIFDASISENLVGLLGEFAYGGKYFNLKNLQDPPPILNLSPLEQWRSLLCGLSDHYPRLERKLGNIKLSLEPVDAFDKLGGNTRKILRIATPYAVGHLAMLIRPGVLCLGELYEEYARLPAGSDDPIPVLDEFFSSWPNTFAEARNRKRWRQLTGKL